MSTGAALGYDQPFNDGLPDEFETARATGAEGDAARLADLSDSLHAAARKLLVDLVLPDPAAGHVVAAITELQIAGVEADVWAIHGLSTFDDLTRVAQAVRAGGREGVGWVLAGPAPDLARDVPGFLGVVLF